MWSAARPLGTAPTAGPIIYGRDTSVYVAQTLLSVQPLIFVAFAQVEKTAQSEVSVPHRPSLYLLLGAMTVSCSAERLIVTGVVVSLSPSA
jgi:hypothetical protein